MTLLIQFSMFFHLLYIHLFRPFLKYNLSNSPLPSHVSPRKVCSQAAGSISKLMRLYKRTYGLRQICNIAVYMVHSACTIHLLNLPDKMAKRDIIHGVKHLEEIAEDWLCARRTLSILSVLARKWKIDLPDESATVFARTDTKYGHFSTADVPSPKQELLVATPPTNASTSPQIQSLPPRKPNQTQLHQSIYSYLPETRNSTSNPQMATSNVQLPPQANRNVMSGSVGSMNITNQQVMSSVPYHRYSDSANSMRAAMTPGNDLPRNNSASETSTITRQVSPNTLFGGVEALVESQDWWLRDQANLFGNWMNFSGAPPQDMVSAPVNGGLNGRREGDAARDLDSMAGIGGGYYLPGSGSGSGNAGNGNVGSDGFDDDWTYG